MPSVLRAILVRVSRMPFFPSPGSGSDWGYAPIPVLGPLIGGAMAGVLIKVVGL